MAEIIKKAIKSKKMIDRKFAAQARGINSSKQSDFLEQAQSPIIVSKQTVPEQEDFGLDEDVLDEDISYLFVERDYFSRGNNHQEI
jgi:hypothetical protein